MTVYVLPRGKVWHRYLDHIRAAWRGQALRLDWPLLDGNWLPLCKDCERRRVAASREGK